MIRAHQAPAPLVVAASLTAIEGLLLVAYAVVEAASFTPSRAAVAITTSLFFASYGAGLIWCAYQLIPGKGWSRSPVVLAQLIQLGVAWSFRGGETTVLAIVLGVVAVVVLAGVLHPSSVDHLVDERSR